MGDPQLQVDDEEAPSRSSQSNVQVGSVESKVTNGNGIGICAARKLQGVFVNTTELYSVDVKNGRG